jgi:EAL domain-containing protein (putative c-di-GMP-specific phosphodiesterase class I)
VSASPPPEATGSTGRPEGLPSAAEVGAVIAAGVLQPQFQPVVDLARAGVVGYESLARFVPPRASPLPWFEAALRDDRAAELEAVALRSSLLAHAILPANTFLTVNIGPNVIDAPPVRAVWAEFPQLGGVVLELTEHERVDSYGALEPVLDKLRAAGALLAIDDAGAGYAGLQHVLTLRPDIIKLDRSLVEGVDRDEAKRALVEMIGTFGSRIDAWLLAEGIETGEELDVLVGLGVPLAQGYFLGRPGPAFPPMAPGAAMRILAQARTSHAAGLRALLEHVPTAAMSGSPRPFDGDTLETVVLLDEHGCPVATVGTDGLVHAIRDSGLRVNVDTPLDQAAQRAIVRPVAQRFQPLVCTDDAGRYVGIVRMERLVEGLARSGNEAGARVF